VTQSNNQLAEMGRLKGFKRLIKIMEFLSNPYQFPVPSLHTVSTLHVTPSIPSTKSSSAPPNLSVPSTTPSSSSSKERSSKEHSSSSKEHSSPPNQGKELNNSSVISQIHFILRTYLRRLPVDFKYSEAKYSTSEHPISEVIDEKDEVQGSDKGVRGQGSTGIHVWIYIIYIYTYTSFS
jgi:hypothetical protein